MARAKNAKVTQWGKHNYWANPRIPSVGDKFVVHREAKSLIVEGEGVLLQDTEARVWTLWDSMMPPIAMAFEQDETEFVLVEFVQHPSNPKWKAVEAAAYGGEPDIAEG